MARTKLHQKSKFLVEFPDRFTSASFTKCSEISMEFADVDLWEGGAIIPFKEPGRMTVADVTLDHGTTNSPALYNWALLCGNAAVAIPGSDGFGSGLVTPEYKSNGSVVQLDRNNDRIVEWALFGAYPKKLVGGAWDNTVDEAVVEMLTLRYDFPQRIG